MSNLTGNDGATVAPPEVIGGSEAAPEREDASETVAVEVEAAAAADVDAPPCVGGVSRRKRDSSVEMGTIENVLQYNIFNTLLRS